MPTGSLNTFGLHQFDYKDSFFSGRPILSQGVGYGIVLGYGAFFVVLTTCMTWFDRRCGGLKNNSEEFNTAGRSVKLGLVSVDAVSRATWVATLLISGNYAFLYGFSGAFWSATSFTQLFLFGPLALEIKLKAPMAHTVVELVYLRWGKFASFVFLYACILTNFIVADQMFIGAANVITAITGMNIYAALVLIPLGVVIYTSSGGLKATYLSSYVHTIVIFVTLNIFIYTVFASDKEPIGSIGKVWDNLNVMATVAPVKDNKGGSYLTMFSNGGLEYGVYSFFAAFGLLFADQAYWQGAIAASPKAAFPGYILGQLLFFPIPIGFALAMGLGAVALDLPISTGEFNEGLVTVATAQYLLGKGGVILMLTILFMSVTSAGSAEFIAMSSLFTYDIFKRHLHPKATSEQVLLVSRVSVVLSGMLVAGTSCVLKVVGIDVNFLFFAGGTLTLSAFAPLALMITWRKVPAGAAIAAVLGGQAGFLTTWLVHTQVEYGRLTVSDTLQRLSPTLDATMVSFILSTVICVVWTLVAPEDGDSFARWQSIQIMDDAEVPNPQKDEFMPKREILNRYYFIAFGFTIFWLIIWPLLTLPAGIFSRRYFLFWVVIAIIWTTIASLIATFLPVIEAKTDLFRILKRSFGLAKNEQISEDR